MTQTPGQIRQKMALERWQQNEQMAAILAAEPRMLIVLQLAIEETNVNERWDAYTNLKQMGSLLVGWYASHPDVRTEHHYNLFIQALDECLPGPEDVEGVKEEQRA